MNNNEKIQKAVKLLLEVSDEWDNDKIKFYPSELGSFDEVIVLLSSIRFNEDIYKLNKDLITEIKEMETYKKILNDSCGGIIFNRANKDKYNKDINIKFRELEKINPDIWNTTDGIFRSIYVFIMRD